MSWKPIYGFLIIGLTLLNYLLGLLIANKQGKQKKAFLITAIATNLILLGIFKYAYFTWDLLKVTVAPFGMQMSALPFQIILPLGISFFVFEFIHYVVEVYKGGRPVKSFINFALFASFFPTQIAGPIKRYQDFIPQLSADSKFKIAMLDEGMGLILFGLFKKVIFADNLAVVVQSGFSRPDLLTSVDLWLVVYAFAFQIYFDFSGYTDIARGSALLLGYKVPINFNLPYLAGSIAEFWHRWHISLSTWLRDYLFIPLGGSRGSKWMTYRNLFITMALGGLWHGAALHFLVWGMYQGVLLMLHKMYSETVSPIAWISNIKTNKIYHALSIVFTFHLVCVGWVFFRADNFSMAISIIEKLLFLKPLSNQIPNWVLTIVNTNEPVTFIVLPFIIALLFVGQLIAVWQNKFKANANNWIAKIISSSPVKAFVVAAVISLLIVFAPDTSPKFIYFQF
jgi:D-alanyl-lipoteichoic acid acyltransferase DltB (MBOAT superfamily)